MTKFSERSATESTIVSFGTDLPDGHYKNFRERKICGISGPVCFVNTAIIIGFLILLGILAIVIFVILHHTL